eukprot:m.284977 g.284977  ORF g.284977 m.284977 type:complete len:71 (-) comp19429_c1_seq3:1030-1242(-)
MDYISALLDDDSVDASESSTTNRDTCAVCAVCIAVIQPLLSFSSCIIGLGIHHTTHDKHDDNDPQAVLQR